jgi:ABC-2 type transport system ATP-binding protein
MPLIRVERLTKQYPGVTALDELSLGLEPGIIGLAGANGAGKSTLLKILLGLLPPTSGTAVVLGFDAARQGVELRRLLGYLPEHDCLPADVSATEFVTHLGRISGLPSGAARERAAEMLRHVGLFEERYRPMGGYSTGMKQRVKLAQALVHDPRMLILDEPTNGLDPQGRRDMLELVQRTGREFGVSVLVSSHLLGELERICDQLVALDSGGLRHAGPVESLTRRTGYVTIEVEDDGTTLLLDRLKIQGHEVELEGRAIRMRMDDEASYSAVWAAAADLGVAIERVEHGRGRLEDLFRDVGSRKDVVAHG